MSNRKKLKAIDLNSMMSAQEEEKKHPLELMQNKPLGVFKPNAVSSQHKTSNNDDNDDYSSRSFEGSFGRDSEPAGEPESVPLAEDTNSKLQQKRQDDIPLITLLDLTDPCLQAVYNEEIDEVKLELGKLYNLNDGGKKFKFTLLMAFWLSIHLEKTEITTCLFEQDPILESNVNMFLQNYKNLDEKERRISKKNRRLQRKQTVDAKKLLKEIQDDENLNLGELAEQDSVNFQDAKSVRMFKYALMTRAGEFFCTKVLRIALFRQEEKIASVILVEYSTILAEDLIEHAVRSKLFNYLHYMWVFEKNWMWGPNKKKIYFDFDYLFKMIQDNCDEKVQEKIDQVTGWKIRVKGFNMLRSLLKNNMDVVACKYSNFYIRDATEDLLLFAMKNENEIFLKHALKDIIFSVNMLCRDKVIAMQLDFIKRGTRVEM